MRKRLLQGSRVLPTALNKALIWANDLERSTSTREKVDQWASSRMVVLTLFKPFQIETCKTQRCAGEAQFSACAIEAQNGSRVSHRKV